MAEGMHASVRIVRVLRQRGEHDARGAEDDRDRARLDDADAERGRLLVARARRRPSTRHGRQPLRRDLERSSDLVAPAPVGDVEEERPRGVRRVDRPLARQAQAHVVLREHDPVDARVDLGLVAAQPEQLRRREAGERPVARSARSSRSSPTRSSISAHSAAVRWSFQRIAGRRTLAVARRGRRGRASAPRARSSAASAPSRARARLARAPPVLGILLGPARLRRREPVALLGRGDDLAVGRDRERLDAGRADVEPDERLRHAPRAAYTSS